MKCRKCQSTRFVKNGRVNGKQRYKCKKCGYQWREKKGLRDISIPKDIEFSGIPDIPSMGSYRIYQQNYSMSAEQVRNVQVVFHNHKDTLIELIGRYEIVLGCVAWLTDDDVLDALAQKLLVQIVVQKEDFLRPDFTQSSKTKSRKKYDEFKIKLRKKYNALPSPSSWSTFGGDFSQLSPISDLENDRIDAVRCMGHHNRDEKSSLPRMHHKFLIFTNGSKALLPIGSPPGDPETNYSERLKVTISENACVWTGSYNITRNATKSLENAVVLHCPKIADAFYGEWAQIALLSEPLDWNNDWCTPQWTFDRNRPPSDGFDGIPTRKVL